ncbi:MAG: ABC transporter permease [Chlorobi bacterium]|jgi:peptide/nickel transport system permease protein|nr:ABC transporter permease [Chlorobiota bacterium]
MLRYIVGRLGYTVLMLLGVVTVSFFLVRAIPGDPARVMLGQRADEATLAALRQQYGFDKPLYVQYWRYLERLAVGDWGRSIASNRPVLEVIADRLPATALLASVAMAIATVLGIVLGVVSALKANTWLDSATMALAQFGISLPSIVMAIFLAVLFGEILPWFPIAGYVDRGIEYLVLPAVTLGIRPLAIIARVTRSSMLDVLGQDYIRTAHAKGLPYWRVMLLHALRNALNPVVTTVGTWFAGLLAGAYFVEYIFNWPGIGSAAFDAITKLDYPLIQGTVLLTAIVFVVVNFFSDVLYALLDPRVELATAQQP